MNYVERLSRKASETDDATEAMKFAQAALSLSQAETHSGKYDDLLMDLRDFVSNYADIEDGSYGIPEPNRAAILVNEIDVIFGDNK